MFGKRNRTSSKYIGHGLYLYFLGLSTRFVAKAPLFAQGQEKPCYLSKSGSGFKSFIQKKISLEVRKRISEYIVDETGKKAGSENIWVWVTIDAKSKEILALFLLKISKERNMFVAERFLSGIVREYGKHPVSTDGEGTWYPIALFFLDLNLIFIFFLPIERKA